MGSIGKRHLSNVYQLINQQGNTCKIDLYRSSFSHELPQEIITKVDNQYSINNPISKTYDMVFITNPTSQHLATVKQFLGQTKSFFIEKPVFDSANVDYKVIRELDSTLAYVACPLRYNPVLQYVASNVDCRKALSVRAISSSYLPDWRPGQDYRQSYSAHRDMGGGVGIDLIHEWDYLTHLFGMPTECQSIQTKISSLEIDSDDLAIYIARNEHMSYELHLDYFGRKSVRTLDIIMPEDTISCDIIAGTVTFLKSNKKICLNSVRNDYQMTEIRHFFDIVERRINNDSSVAHAVKVLNLTKGIIQ
jgi:predicted dehydrogenase